MTSRTITVEEEWASIIIARDEANAENERLRGALYGTREYITTYSDHNPVWAKDMIEKIDAALGIIVDR